MILINNWVDFKFSGLFIFFQLTLLKSKYVFFEIFLFSLIEFSQCSIQEPFVFSSKGALFCWNVWFKQKMDDSFIFGLDHSELLFFLEVESNSLLDWVLFGSDLGDLFVSDSIFEYSCLSFVL